MKEIRIEDLRRYIEQVMGACSMTQENAEIVADIFIRATLRGVGHHDIYDFLPRVQWLREGKANANPVYRLQAAFGGMESYDAGNGLGELGCSFGMDRAMALAEEHGIGLCALRNTNHFLAAAPYVEKAAEKGFIGLLLCKGGVSMGAPGRAGACMSALPMGFAYPTDENYLVMLDACMAYASFGQLQMRAKKGQTVPEWWGLDKNGAPTTDPMELAQGTRFPIGGHKGFGLAMLGEVLTSVMAGGCILDEKETEDGLKNWSAHTAIAIKADALMTLDTFQHRAGTLSRRSEARAPGLHIPGMGSWKAQEGFVAQGTFSLEEGLCEKLNEMAQELNVPQLAI